MLATLSAHIPPLAIFLLASRRNLAYDTAGMSGETTVEVSRNDREVYDGNAATASIGQSLLDTLDRDTVDGGGQRRSRAGGPGSEHHVAAGACGGATIGGLWISPAALAGLRPGQTIETNDKVGTSVTVSDVTGGSVTIRETGPLHRMDCTYDAATGMLSATTLTQQIGLARITHSLRLTGQR
ncbi:MAG: hypothetical protein JW955_24320 [Sedimentisphaerales bacterium]|nr:hypothetical protein [Sedimentisphaerales bacterium]